jgi:spore coat assembly protein SafA
MTLTPMRFKDYVWPHNPRVYEISYKKDIVSHRVPFGLYSLQNMGRQHRVLKGEGEFVGEGAYEQFKALATVFYDSQPGTLVHPLWDVTTAYFAALSLRQEPTKDYVSYEFEFWECYNGYDASIKTAVSTAGSGKGQASSAKTASEKYYTVVYGDCLWSIAQKNGMSLSALVALNPQIKNPNLIYPGDRIRLA